MVEKWANQVQVQYSCTMKRKSISATVLCWWNVKKPPFSDGISLRTNCFPWQKLAQKFPILIYIYPCVQTYSGKFAFHFCSPRSRRQESYLPVPRLYTKNVDKNWNINISFIIHVNFDHAWAEHSPVTLNRAVSTLPIHTYIHIFYQL